MSSVIFKTDANYLPKVVEKVKFALDCQPKNLAPGDTILIAQTLQSLRRGEKQIRYRMTFVKTEPDKDKMTDLIFGHHWDYIIECEALKKLRLPFNIADLENPSKNYGPGGTFVYVAKIDENVLRKLGCFETVDNA